MLKEPHFTLAPNDSPHAIVSRDLTAEHSHSRHKTDTRQPMTQHNKKLFPSMTSTFLMLWSLCCAICAELIYLAMICQVAAAVKPNVVSWAAPVVSGCYWPPVSTKHLTFVSKIQLLPSPRRFCCQWVICLPIPGFINKAYYGRWNLKFVILTERKSSMQYLNMTYII